LTQKTTPVKLKCILNQGTFILKTYYAGRFVAISFVSDTARYAKNATQKQGFVNNQTWRVGPRMQLE